MDYRDTERIKQRLGWQASQSWKSFSNIADSKHGDPLYALQELMWLLYDLFVFLLASVGGHSQYEGTHPRLFIMVHAWNRLL